MDPQQRLMLEVSMAKSPFHVLCMLVRDNVLRRNLPLSDTILEICVVTCAATSLHKCPSAWRLVGDLRFYGHVGILAGSAAMAA